MQQGRHRRATLVVAALTIFAFAAMASSASAATINVACGDVAALRSAITAANGTPAADTIEITGAPCTFTVTNAAVTSTSGNTGFPIITQPLTIEGHGATLTRPSSAPAFRILGASTPDFVNTTRVELRQLTISGGRLTGANQNGAGIAGLLADVVLDRAVLSGNATASRGGGVAVAAGSVDMDRTIVAFNSAAVGGGIYTVLTTSSNDITRSSIYVNGGTVNSGAALIENGSALIENSTVALNASPNGRAGVTAWTSGGTNTASVTVRSSTLTDNGASANAGTAPGTSLWALQQGGAATITVTDSIVGDTDSTGAPTSQPCLEETGGQIVDAAGNVEWPTASCGFGTQADPRIQYQAGGLGNAELFARLRPGSSAIDNGGNDCPAVDQRGEPRPGGDACDSGSWETHPPQTTADGPDGPTNDPQITFTSSEPNSTFQCRVDGQGSFTACTSPFAPTLPEGQHTVEVRAIDGDGEVDPSPASVAFVVDKTPPEVTIDSAPASPTANPDVSVSFHANEDPATFECRVDGGDWAACASPFTTTLTGDGEHTISVRATDQAGNAGDPAIVTVVLDTTAPETTITGGPSGQMYDASATFTFTSSDPNSTFECRLDNGPWASCESPKTVSGYSQGSHTFAVRATDALGNTDQTPATRTFTYKRCLVKVTVNGRVVCL